MRKVRVKHTKGAVCCSGPAMIISSAHRRSIDRSRREPSNHITQAAGPTVLRLLCNRTDPKLLPWECPKLTRVSYILCAVCKPAKADPAKAFREVDLARGDVVQLVRTLPCHGRGRGFESRRPRHSFQQHRRRHRRRLLPLPPNLPHTHETSRYRSLAIREFEADIVLLK